MTLPNLMELTEARRKHIVLTRLNKLNDAAMVMGLLGKNGGDAFDTYTRKLIRDIEDEE